MKVLMGQGKRPPDRPVPLAARHRAAPLHEHVEVEQTYVLEGSIVDAEGEVSAGNYVWRPRGNRHGIAPRARWC